MRSGGLSTALEALAASLCEPAGLAWQVSVEPPVADEDRTLVFSLARELVTNAGKHAAATRVEIRVSASGDLVRLQVRDDGPGFDASAGAVGGHVGLALVENRARAAYGRLEIGAAPGGGTLATVELATSGRLTAAAAAAQPPSGGAAPASQPAR
jgi:two-component system NarL family sensor kinase